MSDMDTLKRDFHPVKIIRRSGDLKSAETSDHITVYRKKSFHCGGIYGIVKAAPYDNQFIFEDPGFKKGIIGRSQFMCTCGSWGVIVGSKAYQKDGSPTTKLESTNAGQMLVCWHHMTFGRHGDGSS
jgi:hypothetical protein